jgi:hypothetical protein
MPDRRTVTGSDTGHIATVTIFILSGVGGGQSRFDAGFVPFLSVAIGLRRVRTDRQLRIPQPQYARQSEAILEIGMRKVYS